jgi:phenylpropionate dioxygenase-like ring-hydroxylating dioxygenase large terminal subunit
MFVSSEHLPQLLSSEDYTSTEQYKREVNELFLPAWHLIGTADELPNDGDFLTTNLFGRPLIVWNRGGSFRTFLNVCPHRFSRLVHADCGQIDGNIVCQYHGWEFDDAGCTRKIPDARSFRPMVQGSLGLTAYRTETCGKLIFASLAEQGPSLAEFLGAGYDIAANHASKQQRLCASLEFEYDVNWKIKVENSLESYHLEMVHTSTFGQVPKAEECYHELHPRSSRFWTAQEPSGYWQKQLDRIARRLAHTEITDTFEHSIHYPHIMLGSMGLFRWAEMVLPLSATRTWNVMKLYSYGGTSGTLKSRILCWILGQWGKRFLTKVAIEDQGIIGEVQRGHCSPAKPSEGVISVREERCFHFQDYISRLTAEQPAINERSGGHAA